MTSNQIRASEVAEQFRHNVALEDVQQEQNALKLQQIIADLVLGQYKSEQEIFKDLAVAGINSTSRAPVVGALLGALSGQVEAATQGVTAVNATNTLRDLIAQFSAGKESSYGRSNER